jgi:tyrosyl-tRNA synthetase
VTRLVHGEQGLDTARRASAVLFGESMAGLEADDLLEIFADVPSTELPAGDVEGAPVTDLAAASGLCGSKGEARRLIAGGGLYLNNVKVADVAAVVESSDIVDDRVLVLRSGKKTFHLVRVVP